MWKDILAPKRSWIKITPEDCHVVVRGNTAYAYCFERVVSDAAVSSPFPLTSSLFVPSSFVVVCGTLTCACVVEQGQNNEQRLFATNVFVRRQGMWFIVHHHATLLKVAGQEKQGQGKDNAALMQQLQVS